MGRPEDVDSSSSPLSSSPDQSPTRRAKFNFDALVTELGEFGPFQRWLYFLLWFPAASMAIGVYAFIFMEYVPEFQCFDARCPVLNGTDQCTKPVFDADCTPDTSVEPIGCSQFWFDDSVFTQTVISEFNAVCSDAYLRKMSTSIYMSGMLFGSFFFGWFSDRFGRRICFAITVMFLAGGSLMSAFALNYPMYIASRFITSMGGMGIFITAFVISMEFIGPNYRTSCGIGIEIPFALGELYLALMAYLLRNWRHLQLAIGLPFLGFLLYLIKLPESVRWAVASGRTDVAMKSIRRLADFNNCKLPSDLCLNQEDDFVAKKRMSSSALLTSASLRNRFIIMAINWVVTTLCYYGLGMSASLIGDVFTTFSIAACMEVPSYIFCMLAVDRWGRKPILSFAQILAALACITAGFLPEEQYEARLCFVLIGKFGASASFAIVFLYTAELFPTPLRNTAVGLCSTFARLGAILAPTVADLGNIQLQLPFLVMGGSTLVGGLAAISLPETAGKQLPDTLEEALSMSQETILVEVEDELEKGEKSASP